jgi:TM2 domain-containing membrane protein YozV
MTEQLTNTEKQWLIYFLVLLFFGFLGIHKFYVKKNVAGAVQLSLFFYWIIASVLMFVKLDLGISSIIALTGTTALVYLGVWLLLDLINALIHVGNDTWTTSLIPAGKQ